MFHICRTIRQHFSLRQVKLCIGQWKYKQKFTTQGRKEWPTDQPSKWICARSLNSYFAICKIVLKNWKWMMYSVTHSGICLRPYPRLMDHRGKETKYHLPGRPTKIIPAAGVIPPCARTLDRTCNSRGSVLWSLFNWNNNKEGKGHTTDSPWYQSIFWIKSCVDKWVLFWITQLSNKRFVLKIVYQVTH